MRLDHLLSKEKVEKRYGLTVELSRFQIVQGKPHKRFRMRQTLDNIKFPVPMRPGDTPVPIPNTTVKAWAADGTTLETAWESRRVPDSKNGGVAQLGEHLPCKQGVESSNLFISS